MTNPSDLPATQTRKSVRIVVCESGNVRSVVRAIELAASRVTTSPVEVTRDAAVVRGADILVVPGQGAFGPFVRGMQGALADSFREHLAAKKPYLGICLGMQMLFEWSEEASEAERGLAHFRGAIRRLAPGIDPTTGQAYALPHIGWNSVTSAASAESPHFYFAHTFAAAPEDDAIITGRTEYGASTFASIVGSGNVLGVQFHPEKSQLEGQRLLTRFFETHV